MAKPKILSDYSSYAKFFSPSEMWDKIVNVSKKAGAKTIYAVLLLYYASTDPSISWTDKVKIYGALGYFILPLDLVPDALPIVGYGDDLAAVIFVIKSICDNISAETHRKALNKLSEWFGDIDQNTIQSFHKEAGIHIQEDEYEKYVKDDYSTDEKDCSEEVEYYASELDKGSICHGEDVDNESQYFETEKFEDDYDEFPNVDFSEKEYLNEVKYYLKLDGEITNYHKKTLELLREEYGISESRASKLEQLAKNKQR